MAKKKPSVKKANVKKVAPKTATKKTPAKSAKKPVVAKKAAAKKAVVKKAAGKKPATKKSAGKKPVAKKATVKKAASKKTATKKAVAVKAGPKKVAVKKTAKKSDKKTAAKAPKAVAPVAHLLKTAAPAKKLDLSGFVTPLDDRLMVQVSGAERMTAGGLYIPDTVSDTSGNLQGVVVAVGRGHMNKKGHVRPMDVRVGDKVVFSEYSGSKIKIQNEDLIILREADVMGVVSK